VIDGLGILTGVGLLSISIGTWASGQDAARAAAMVTVPAYCVWAFGLGMVYWRLARQSSGHKIIEQTSAAHG